MQHVVRIAPVVDAESFRRTKWQAGDPASEVSAWHFYLDALEDALRAELAALGLYLGREMQVFEVADDADVTRIAARVLEVLRRDLPDQLLQPLTDVLVQPGAHPGFPQLVASLRGSNDKPETQGGLAVALCRHARPEHLPALCELMLDPSIGPSGRFNLVANLKRRRRFHPNLHLTLERLRADPDIGADVGLMLDGKLRR